MGCRLPNEKNNRNLYMTTNQARRLDPPQPNPNIPQDSLQAEGPNATPYLYERVPRTLQGKPEMLHQRLLVSFSTTCLCIVLRRGCHRLSQSVILGAAPYPNLSNIYNPRLAVTRLVPYKGVGIPSDIIPYSPQYMNITLNPKPLNP